MSLKALVQAVLECVAKEVVNDESAVEAIAKAALHLGLFGILALTHLLLEIAGAPLYLKVASSVGVIPILVPLLSREFRLRQARDWLWKLVTSVIEMVRGRGIRK